MSKFVRRLIFYLSKLLKFIAKNAVFAGTLHLAVTVAAMWSAKKE